jgi:hypothetical protein
MEAAIITMLVSTVTQMKKIGVFPGEGRLVEYVMGDIGAYR